MRSPQGELFPGYKPEKTMKFHRDGLTGKQRFSDIELLVRLQGYLSKANIASRELQRRYVNGELCASVV